ncbi:MAG: PKD domain-containing protein, partial [Bacteroidia bacterium]
MILTPTNTIQRAKAFFRFFVLVFILLAASNKVSADCLNITTSFVPSQLVICGPGATSISFTNTSTGTGAAGATYTWYLNGVLFDNTTGLAAPMNSTISAVGSYTYMMIAHDPSVPCKDTVKVIVVIRPVPVAAFTFTPDNQCAGTTISFTNTSTGTGAFTTYAWNFGDGGTST